MKLMAFFRYESLVETVGKKFSRKRKSKEILDSNESENDEKQARKKTKKKKAKFLKPKED